MNNLNYGNIYYSVATYVIFRIPQEFLEMIHYEVHRMKLIVSSRKLWKSRSRKNQLFKDYTL